MHHEACQTVPEQGDEGSIVRYLPCGEGGPGIPPGPPSHCARLEGQIVILGAPNVGKSSIISKVTKAQSTVAPYPFTNREPFPGMMETDEVRIQLIDLPPITKDHLESWQANTIRNADAALLVIDLVDDDGLTATQEVLDRLLEAKIKLSFDDDSDASPEFDWTRCLVVGTKIDQPDADFRQ